MIKKRINRLRARVKAWPIWNTIRAKLDAIIVHREKEISLWTVMLLFRRQMRRNHIQSQSNGVAFNFTLALFPSIIFLFTLIPYIPVHDLNGQIMLLLSQVLPQTIFEAAASTIADIIGKQRGGLLSFGFLMALYLSTNGTMALMDAFNRCYRTRESRSPILRRLTAVVLTLVISLVLVAGLVLMSTGKVLEEYVHTLGLLDPDTTYYILRVAQYLLFIFLFLVAVAILYVYAPAVHKRWRFFSIGAVASTVMMVLVSMGFAYYLNNFATYNKVYGSIGTLIGLMLWLKFISMVLLVGFEINASIDAAKQGIDPRKLRS